MIIICTIHFQGVAVIGGLFSWMHYLKSRAVGVSELVGQPFNQSAVAAFEQVPAAKLTYKSSGKPRLTL